MKKSLRILSAATVLLALTLILIQCSDDEKTYGIISGNVTLADESPADGAIVYLSKTANAAEIVAKTIADADGLYSIIGIEAGTYYLSATFEADNNNNLKSAGAVILTGPEKEVSVSGDVDADLILGNVASSGTAVVDIADGWVYDNTHSMIAFEFPYDAVNAIFSGHFTTAGIDVLHFDEANAANIQIAAWVDITSVETGAPSYPCGHGRDGITGCIANTFKVVKDAADTVENYCSDGSVVTNWPNEELAAFDLWGNGTSTYTKQHSIVGASGVATFKSTSVVAYGTGYVATGDFTFSGVTHEVSLFFNYLEGYTKDAADKTTDYVSLYGFFKFAAAADFGIVSGHVGDNEVTVKLSIQLNKVTPK